MTSIAGSISQSSGELAFKRGLDLYGAVVALILFSPVILVVCLLLRFDTPGKILFRQTRIGKNGRPIKMLKFRTMRSDFIKEIQEFLD